MVMEKLLAVMLQHFTITFSLAKILRSLTVTKTVMVKLLVVMSPQSTTLSWEFNKKLL